MVRPGWGTGGKGIPGPWRENFELGFRFLREDCVLTLRGWPGLDG